jgi:hypothetical protein
MSRTETKVIQMSASESNIRDNQPPHGSGEIFSYTVCLGLWTAFLVGRASEPRQPLSSINKELRYYPHDEE